MMTRDLLLAKLDGLNAKVCAAESALKVYIKERERVLEKLSIDIDSTEAAPDNVNDPIRFGI